MVRFVANGAHRELEAPGAGPTDARRLTQPGPPRSVILQIRPGDDRLKRRQSVIAEEQVMSGDQAACQLSIGAVVADHFGGLVRWLGGRRKLVWLR